MAIADTITSMQNHTSNAYTMIGYGTDLTGINKNLENLSTSIFNAFLEALRTPDTLFTNLPKKSGTGANITLNDTANAPMRITLSPSELTQGGTPTPSSPQDIHTISGSNKVIVCGKNLIKYPYQDTTKSSGGISWTLNNDNTILVNGSNTSGSTQFFNIHGTGDGGLILNAGTYIFSLGVASKVRASIAEYESNTNICVINVDTESNTFTLNEKTKVRIFLAINNNLSASNVLVKPMLNLGSTALSYEPYISQEADIDLKSKNSFKETGSVTNGTYNNGLYISNSLSSYQIMNMSGEDITYIANTKYYVSMLLRRTSGTGGINAINVGTSTGVVNHFPTISNEFQKFYIEFTPTSDYTSNKISVQVGSASAVFEVKNLMVSTENIDYEPYYNYGEYCKIGNYEDKFIRNSGKNLFDESTMQLNKNINTEGVIGNYDGCCASEQYIEVEPNTTYTFSCSISPMQLRVNKYTSNKTNIERIFGANTNIFTFTTDSNCYYVRLSIYSSNSALSSNYLDTIQFQLEKGNATEYEPYGSNQWYIKKNIGKVDLGSLSWSYFSTEPTFMYNLTLPVYSNTQNTLCEVYPYSQSDTNKCYRFNANILRIYDSDYNDTTTFQTAMSGKMLYYQLATPTYTQITGTLETQLENVYKNMLSQEGQTNISQVNNDLSFNMSVLAIEEL